MDFGRVNGITHIVTLTIIFLISDGVPECYDENVKPQEAEAMAFSKAYIKREVAANRLVVISVEVSDHCDHALMRELTGLKNDKHVTKVSNASELANFFKVTEISHRDFTSTSSP